MTPFPRGWLRGVLRLLGLLRLFGSGAEGSFSFAARLDFGAGFSSAAGGSGGGTFGSTSVMFFSAM
jgi:hypothetical protein